MEEATGYGTGTGLKGWNCHHDFYPVIDGVSTPSYTEEELKNIDPPPIEYKGETLTYYECTQKQRKMETAMRKTKREIIGAKGADDDEQFIVKSVLLRRQREEYNAFSEKAGLLTQNERTPVYGFDRSMASKSSWAAKKLLTSTNKYDKIPLEKLNTKIRTVKQKEHILGTKQWLSESKKEIAKGNNPKSFFYKDINIQQIVDKNYKNAALVYENKSKYPIQYITLESSVGKVFDKKVGKYIETKRLAVIHSSKGFHAFPVFEKNRR